MTDNVTATGFDATVTLGSIVSEALGPQPRVCQETVLLDLERARMTAEDLRMTAENLRSAAISPYSTNNDPRNPRLTWRECYIERHEEFISRDAMNSRRRLTMRDQMHEAAGLSEVARDRARIATDSNGDREDLRVALIDIQNILVDARRALHDEDSESDERSDEEMSDEESDGASDGSDESISLASGQNNLEESNEESGGSDE